VTTSSVTVSDFGSNPAKGHPAGVVAVGQYILNSVTTAARRSADRRRLAMLPRRYLDDAGITLGELDSALPGMEPSFPRNAQNILTRSV
jgi:hypothetical protein